MGVVGLSAFISQKFPHLKTCTPDLGYYAGRRVFIDCAFILQRSLNASLRTTLAERKDAYLNSISKGRAYIDVPGIKNEILGNAVKPLLVLNQALKAVKTGGGVLATFVLSSGISSKDAYGSTKSDRYLNILNTANPNLLQHLINHFQNVGSIEIHAVPMEKDIYAVADRLADQHANIEIRDPEITKRCVEFCSSELDYVFSDDTKAIAYGAPNVIRSYFGPHECYFISHRRLLEAMGISRSMFIDFCILCGFGSGVKIPQIGPDRAYKIMQSFGSLENFLESQLYVDLLNSVHSKRLLDKLQMDATEFKNRYFNLELLRSQLAVGKIPYHTHTTRL